MKRILTPVTTRTVILFLSLLGTSFAALVCFVETSVSGQSAAVSPQAKTTDQIFKNIQVFKGLPASQLDPTMAFISGSLGVRCSFCHVSGAFDKDDRAQKQAARRMIKMVSELNKGNFGGDAAVTCFTCHRGKSRPEAIPFIGENLSAPRQPAAKENPLPTVDQILDRYVQALGGRETLTKITSRVVKGSRIGADGVLVPEEVFQKSPNRLLTITSYPNVVFRNGYNGTLAWGHSTQNGLLDLPPQLAVELRRESDFHRNLKLKEVYSKLTVTGREKINNADAYVIEAMPASGAAERLYFDSNTGLLIRRYIVSETFLGKLPLQIDFEDFRNVDGAKEPFLIHWSMPGRIWGRKLNEIKHNIDLSDSQFDPPKK